MRPGRVVVLDAGAADVADAPVDDDDLAVVEVAEVVEAPVDLSLVRSRPSRSRNAPWFATTWTPPATSES